MKATGIVRRLDDLGRLVIPKEIRKQYRLKEGDSIEFFIENDRIVIQRFDVLSKHMEEINIMVDTLQALYQEQVLFVQEEWLRIHHTQISESFFKMSHTHRVTRFHQEALFSDKEEAFDGLIFPVIAFGDWLGAFVILLQQHSYEPEQIPAFQAYCELLSRQQTQ